MGRQRNKKNNGPTTMKSPNNEHAGRSPLSLKSPELVLNVIQPKSTPSRQKKRNINSSPCTTPPVLKSRRTFPIYNENNQGSVPWHRYDELYKRFEDLEIEYALLQRDVETRDLRIIELEGQVADLENKLSDQTQKWHTSCQQIETLQDHVDILSTDRGALRVRFEKAEALQPQLQDAQRHLAKMHDAMLDMEYEIVRMREQSRVAASNSHSQSHAIRQELRGLKRRRCVSQSRWFFGEDGCLADDELNESDSEYEKEYNESEDNATSGEDDADTSFPIHEIDFLDVAEQIVHFSKQKVHSQANYWTEMEEKLHDDSITYQNALAEENGRKIYVNDHYLLDDFDAWEQILLEINDLLCPVS